MISLLIILLSHHLLEILKKSLTNEKIIDCVKKPQQEYEKIYEILVNEKKSNDILKNEKVIDEKENDELILTRHLLDEMI
jgi:flagellar biosynthesis chaperone FliJ